MIDMEPYQRSMKECLAACNDMVARRNGCSDYERRLREMSPVCLYRYDPTFREIMIKLKAMEYAASQPWWAR